MRRYFYARVLLIVTSAAAITHMLSLTFGVKPAPGLEWVTVAFIGAWVTSVIYTCILFVLSAIKRTPIAKEQDHDSV